VPESSVTRDALMVVVGHCGSKASDLGCRGLILSARAAGRVVRPATSAKRLRSSARIWKKEGELRLPKIMPTGMIKNSMKTHANTMARSGWCSRSVVGRRR
jgi:hypothetical protein